MKRVYPTSSSGDCSHKSIQSLPLWSEDQMFLAMLTTNKPVLPESHLVIQYKCDFQRKVDETLPKALKLMTE
jgi:hypothetical protein